MMSRTFRILVVASLSSIAACGSKPTGEAPGATSAPAPKRDPNVITEAELADPSVGTADALTAVRKLRPSFLLSRGSGSIQNKSAGSVHVSINNGALVSLSELTSVRAADVKEIRYMSATDAAQKFGTAAGSGGVLVVKTR